MPSYLDIGALQSSVLDIGPLQSQSGPTPINKTLSDALTFSDSSSFVGPPDLHLLIGDTLNNWADLLIFPGAVFPLTLNDSLAISDSFGGTTIQPALFFGDALSILDQFLNNFPLVLVFNDSFTISDLLTLINLFVVNENLPTDGINVQDGIILNLATVIAISPNDSLAFSDAMQDVLSIPLSLTDNIKNWNDLFILGTTQNVGLLIEDFLLFLDALFARTASFYSFSDSNSFSDSLSFLVQNTSQTEGIGDSYVLGDSLSIQLNSPIGLSFNDSYSLSDGFVISIPEPLNNYLRRYLNDVVN
jgi:hypothetical protein